MARGLWVAVCFAVVGCQSANRTHYAAPPDQLPGPSQVGGTGIVIDDHRPDWEKRPFTGSISLYHLGKVKPNPWDQLARETEAVVGMMPQKPERITVTVTSFRLVKKDIGAPATVADPVQVRVGDRTNDQLNQADSANKWNYQTAVAAQRAGDNLTAQQALGVIAGQGPSTGPKSKPPAIGLGVGSVKPAENTDAFAEYPPGANCEIHAVVRMSLPSGQEQVLQVKGLGSGQNTSGTAYWGEALEFSVKQAVFDYGQQFRQGVGLPPGG